MAYNSDTSRTLTIPVVVSLGDVTAQRNAGTQFVLLVYTDDNGDTQTAAQAVASAQDGVYQFHFDNVPAGTYRLVAGSDLDNDGYICAAGESCAEYPVLGSPQLITVGDQPITGLDMTTSYRRPVLSAASLPRPDFKGYALLDKSSGSALRRVQSGGDAP